MVQEFKKNISELEEGHMIYGFASGNLIHEGVLYNPDDLANGRLKEINSSKKEVLSLNKNVSYDFQTDLFSTWPTPHCQSQPL